MAEKVHANPYSSMDGLETTYQIAKFIHSHGTCNEKDNSGKPYSSYQEHFADGPNPFYNQTKAGLVLEEYYDAPSIIHTPYGKWTILADCSGRWDKVVEAIKKPLGLVLLKAKKEPSMGIIGPFWAITKWQNKKIEMPVYKKQGELTPYDTVKETWKKFSTLYSELSKKT